MKLRAIASMTALTLVLAACTVGVAEEVTTTTEAPATTVPEATTTQPTEPQVTKANSEEVFIAIYAEWSNGVDFLTWYDLLPDSHLIETAHTTCQALDAGATIQELFDVIVESAVTGDDAESGGALVAAAIYSICPTHVPALENFLDSMGMDI